MYSTQNEKWKGLVSMLTHVQVKLPSVSLGLLSYRTNFMSKYGNANHYAIYQCKRGTVASSLSGALLL